MHVESESKSSIIILNRAVVPESNFAYLDDNLLIDTASQKLYKVTHHTPGTCFIGDTISTKPIVTITSYDPVFLATKKVQRKLVQGQSSGQEFVQLETLYSHNEKYLVEAMKKLCETKEHNGEIYYRPSKQKVLNILESKYRRLVEGISKHSIDIRVGMELQGQEEYMNPVVRSLLQNDINKSLVMDLAQKLNLNKTALNKFVVPDTFVQDQARNAQKSKPTNNGANFQKPKPTASRPSKTQAIMNNIKKTNKSMTDFFKSKDKKDSTSKEQVSSQE